uniref:HDC19713 n=1 Tax=Drosophila melanogaster TaxID=7227 RepID=Q6II51_DROME|nr:TPA_inf: HDC19713 [Drosophila melanogaster]
MEQLGGWLIGWRTGAVGIVMRLWKLRVFTLGEGVSGEMDAVGYEELHISEAPNIDSDRNAATNSRLHSSCGQCIFNHRKCIPNNFGLNLDRYAASRTCYDHGNGDGNGDGDGDGDDTPNS